MCMRVVLEGAKQTTFKFYLMDIVMSVHQWASNTTFLLSKRQLNISTSLVFCGDWERPCRNKEVKQSEGFFHLEHEFSLLFSLPWKNLTLLASTKEELPFNRCFNSQKVPKNDEQMIDRLVVLLVVSLLCVLFTSNYYVWRICW